MHRGITKWVLSQPDFAIAALAVARITHGVPSASRDRRIPANASYPAAAISRGSSLDRERTEGLLSHNTNSPPPPGPRWGRNTSPPKCPPNDSENRTRLPPWQSRERPKQLRALVGLASLAYPPSLELLTVCMAPRRGDVKSPFHTCVSSTLMRDACTAPPICGGPSFVDGQPPPAYGLERCAVKWVKGLGVLPGRRLS